MKSQVIPISSMNLMFSFRGKNPGTEFESISAKRETHLDIAYPFTVSIRVLMTMIGVLLPGFHSTRTGYTTGETP